MPEDQIADYIPFDGRFGLFWTLHGSKAVADVLVDVPTNAHERFI